MTNGKNSFLQVVKLPNVRGRVRYISDPKRQENLYATFTNVESKYWSYLSKEDQKDFRKSGTEGKCIEARELIIMLPPSLIQYDPDMLLKYFSAKFVEKYDVAVVSALHHNKAKTNLHIHLIFSERQACFSALKIFSNRIILLWRSLSLSSSGSISDLGLSGCKCSIIRGLTCS